MTEWTLPIRGLFVTGTDTEVGKTWITVQLLKTLRQLGEAPLCARKPVASGATMTANGQLLSEDTRRLAQASQEPCSQVTRWTFAPPISPARAAREAGADTSLTQLLAACRVPADCYTLIEGAGGFCSPLGSDGSLNADLAERLQLPVLLVVGRRLGCINHTLLTVETIHRRGLHLAGIILNEYADATFDTATAEELRQHLPPTSPFFHMPHRMPPPAWRAWCRTLAQSFPGHWRR